MGTSFQPEAFGKYYLVDKIATGGMAEIFKAKTYSHGGFENLIVIKRILSHLGDNEEFVEMFIDEAKVSVALQHANIVRIYDFGKILENYFIAMEMVDGKDVRGVLRKLSRKRRFLPVEFAAFVAHEVCKGLEYAHKKTDLQGRPYGIVHRDISPSNILVSYEGDVKIADFGIAKAEQNTYNTKDGVLKGKFEYMSPEQASGIPIDNRSDIFSLGIILYEMLTGRRLFKTDSDVATLEKIKNTDVDPPSTLNARVPERLEKIVMKALARDREVRYQNAKEMQDDLLEFLFPATPDVTRQSFQRFMAGLFEDEISAERERLEEGSRIANELRENQPLAEEWDGTATSTMRGPAPERRRAWPIVLLLLAFLLFTGSGVMVALFAFGVLNMGETPEEIAEPTEGTLDIMVLPAATITVNGEPRGEGASLSLADLEPGTYQVKLEAEGYEVLEDSIEVVAGEIAKFQRTLEPLPGTEVEEPVEDTDAGSSGPRPAVKGPPVVRFTSNPSGALVFVDGALVGTTPFTWRDGAPGGSYGVEYKLEGYQPASGTVNGLARGSTKDFSLTLRAGAAQPGKLTVKLMGGAGGWGNVYVNGEKIGRAPGQFELQPGNYTVRVENPEIGLDHEQSISVKEGGTAVVLARL